MATYRTFTTARTTEPDLTTLQNQLRNNIDPTTGTQHTPGSQTYTLKRSGTVVWTAQEITNAQAILDTCAPRSDKLSAQAQIDALTLQVKGIALTLLDIDNAARARDGLGPISQQQLVQAVKDKIGTF